MKGGLSKDIKFEVIKGAVKVDTILYSKTKEYTHGLKSKSSFSIPRANIGIEFMKELNKVISDNFWNFDLNTEGNLVAIVSNNRVDMSDILNNSVNNNKISDEYYVVKKLDLPEITENAIQKHTLVLYNLADKQSVFDMRLKEKGGQNEAEKVKSMVKGYLNKLWSMIQSAFLSNSFDDSLFFSLLTGATGPFIHNMKNIPSKRMGDIYSMIVEHEKSVIAHFQFELANNRLPNGVPNEGVIRQLCKMIIAAHNARDNNLAFNRKHQDITDLTTTKTPFSKVSFSSASTLSSKFKSGGGSSSSISGGGSSSSTSSKFKSGGGSSSSSSSKIKTASSLSSTYNERMIELATKEIDKVSIFEPNVAKVLPYDHPVECLS